ncbi:hypothetical protein OJAV_G00231240 [Oryzias javanicus]|uniref:Serpin domain-containing protein n=1 Tax=Oryzias javanicus TaxID=123683 RepID=A0A437BZS1_ORYJA|nr:hypothetical protein OJAV_G00231240 [Oryzias javanicus]
MRQPKAANVCRGETTAKAVKMRGLFLSCALTALLLAAAWADHHHGHSHDGEMMCHKLAPPNADFAFALYKNFNAKTAAGKNIFFSSLGIATALSMLSTGARGDTQSQLFSTLGYSGFSQEQVNEAYEHLFHMLGHSQEDQQLDVGNTAAVRTGFSPLESFIAGIKKHYSGEVLNVDFSKPQEATAEINKHIASKTNDKIKDMVKDLDPETAMVLINYVYFRGQWEKPFDANLTTKGEFRVDENTKVEVDMMKKTSRFDHYEDNENQTTVVLLPYKGNTSMMILLPDEGKMKQVEDFIDKDKIWHWHNSLFKNNVNFFMPKFSISVPTSLDDTLKEMGVTNAFGDKADFSGMSSEVMLKLSRASHQAVLSVDETGTEAAAGTTMEIMPMSMPMTVMLNRPFIVLILEHSTKSILFMGKINNPIAE